LTTWSRVLTWWETPVKIFLTCWDHISGHVPQIDLKPQSLAWQDQFPGNVWQIDQESWHYEKPPVKIFLSCQDHSSTT
jgi:hypothetical protein